MDAAAAAAAAAGTAATVEATAATAAAAASAASAAAVKFQQCFFRINFRTSQSKMDEPRLRRF